MFLAILGVGREEMDGSCVWCLIFWHERCWKGTEAQATAQHGIGGGVRQVQVSSAAFYKREGHCMPFVQMTLLVRLKLQELCLWGTKGICG